MKIAIIGGGPAGLYAAILLKKQRPDAGITVYERNRADDTFGFGVVFSDATLDNFEKYDSRAIAALPRSSPIGMISPCTFGGTVHRVGRQRLLRLLASQAAFDPAGAGARTRRHLDVRSRHRGPRPALRCRSRSLGDWHQQPLPRQIYRAASSPRWTFVPMCSPGWVRPGTRCFTFIFRKRSGARVIAHAYHTKLDARPGSSRQIHRPSSVPGWRA